jgi:hypothetical protein
VKPRRLFESLETLVSHRVQHLAHLATKQNGGWFRPVAQHDRHEFYKPIERIAIGGATALPVTQLTAGTPTLVDSAIFF